MHEPCGKPVPIKFTGSRLRNPT